MHLPEHFLSQMKDFLGEEYEAWLASYDRPPVQGLRINRRKLSPEEWEAISPYGTCRVPWTENGYYCDAGSRPALDPYYYAGLYYIQEPSAMAPAALLDVKPGERVLDLCAAPGGKSTELGARLMGRGLLVSNDISVSRAKALLKNLEMAGIGNILVTAETPEKLADTFGAYFDKILVDAPCSGEGMFRKEPELIRSWQERGPSYYAPIQREILSQAVRMLKPGGELVYSTCTFSEEEDEGAVRWILEQEPELTWVPLPPGEESGPIQVPLQPSSGESGFSQLPAPLWEGAVGGLGGEPVIRLFPHRVRGEGHFTAKLRKKAKASQMESAWAESLLRTESSRTEASQIRASRIEAPRIEKSRGTKGRRSSTDMSDGKERRDRREQRELLSENSFLEWEGLLAEPFDRDRLYIRDDQVYLLPEGFDPSWRLRFLRTGLLLGSWKKGRFEPSQAAAMYLRRDQFAQVLSLDRSDERVIRYLKGETISLSESEREGSKGLSSNGWVLVCVDGYTLGWAKWSGNTLKNKYYAGWRWQ